jgi:uncharacterized protein YbjT (DUF2867 family)
VKVVLFGATGMIGQGVLRECLADPKVEEVLAVARSPSGVTHAKLREVAHPDFFDFSALAPRLAGFDACFFCLGVTSAGLSEADYARTTYDITMAAARAFAQASPQVRFVYVSGAGTDGTEKGRSMWARVKGRTENALLRELPRSVMFRPGYIQPMDGIRSRTGWYRVFYAVARPLYPALRRMAPKVVTNTRDLGLAMLEVAERGSPARIVESDGITRLARARRA